MSSLPYTELTNQFAPLDLLLFRGTSLFSQAIMFAQKVTTDCGDYSHAAILVNSEILPTVPQLLPGRWYVWESTLSQGVPNVEGSNRVGVQIRDLEQVMVECQDHKGIVAWGKLLANPWRLTENNPRERKQLIKTVCATHKIYGNRVYDYNPLSLLAVVFPCWRKPRDVFNKIVHNGYLRLVSRRSNEDDSDLSGYLFCSELVAHVYIAIGVIEKSKDPQNVLPVDFLGYDQDGIPCITEPPIAMMWDGRREVFRYAS